ncbi:MAG: Rieske 2Fe-2S domain-containing protein [Alphaproteobacteria bacterium]|nr:Rieske 2Fe-2S domain-containing protein [Alphaproteobacteria bacterium]
MSAEARLAIDIDAPVDVVWGVLTDLASYGRWNPMTPRVVGRLAEGEVLQLTARVGSWMRTQAQTVYELVPNERLVWSGAFGGELVRGVRTQTVEALPGDRTRYTTRDAFHGPLAGLTKRLYGDTLHAGFQAMAEALKDTCEAQVGRSSAPSAVRVPVDLEQQRLPHRASWYPVALGTELAPGQVRHVTLCGQDLVVWRTKGGRVGAARNVCGHMAARLAPGAWVQGEKLVCPHHHMGFTVTGRSCEHTARDLSTLHVREVGPAVLVWYHPEGAAPTFEVPEPEQDGFGGWSFKTLDLPVHPQHVMEDLADARHFLSVHRYRTLDTLQGTQADGSALSFHGVVGWDPGLKVLPSVPVEFRTTAYGMGFQVTEVAQVGGLVHSLHLVLLTPVDEHTTRVVLGVATRLGDGAKRALGKAGPVVRRVMHEAAAYAFRRDVLRDAALWAQRHHHDDHAPPGDPAHAVFRDWVAQFDAREGEAA